MQSLDLESFLADNTYAESTGKTYSYMITRALKYLESLEDLTPRKFRDWLFNEKENWSNSTRWLGYNALRAFIKWKYGKDHPALDFSMKREEPGPQRTLSLQDAQLLDRYLSQKDDTKGVRDLAIFSLLLDTGLRSSELCRVDRDLLDIHNRTLTVKIKGGDWGAAIFSEVTSKRLIDWLHLRVDMVNGSKALFLSTGGIKPGTRITPAGLRNIVRKWGERAEIGALSPHDFRRTFATIATINHAPPRMLQIAGRWSRLKEVERYTKGLRLLEFDQYLPMRLISTR